MTLSRREFLETTARIGIGAVGLSLGGKLIERGRACGGDSMPFEVRKLPNDCSGSNVGRGGAGMGRTERVRVGSR